MKKGLSVSNLGFSYGENRVIPGFSLFIEAGEITSIIGPNGVGKSTLVKCLCNILTDVEGSVFFHGQDLLRISPKELAKILGYVPQKDSDVFSITVYEAVLLGRRPYIQWKVRPIDIEIVEEILAKLSIESLAQRPLNTLSGGERQRVAIARALAQEPEVLILDEPTSSLDINHQVELMNLLRSLAYEEGAAVVVVLHDLNLAARYSDAVFLLGPGEIYALGRPDQVFTPENIFHIYGIQVEVFETDHGLCIIPVDHKKDEVVMEMVAR